MSEQNMIVWEQDDEGIVTLTMDDPNQSANTWNALWMASMRATVARLVEQKDSITGVVLTSAKKTFFAGGDLNDLRDVTLDRAGEVFEAVQSSKATLRSLETLGRPVVAAINGAALGGGFEIALATHHRIAADAPGSRIGLPEVTLGLLAGGGGVVRTVRMLGVVDAMVQVLGQGQRHTPARALALGLVNEVVAPGELIDAAKAWIRANPDAVQPWDVKGYLIPGGTPAEPAFAANLPALPANLRKQLKGAPYPAPRAILAAAVESTQLGIDDALLVESRYLIELLTGQVAKNMIKAFFFDMQHIAGGGSRPEGFPRHTVKRVGVLGAGMMGAGIAHVCAKAGLVVVLKDVSLENAERGRGYSQGLVDKAVARGQMTEQAATELMSRIIPTEDPGALDGVDLVIEAVFESTELKHQVFAEIQDVVTSDAILGSNTSTLPITGLAAGVDRPADFIGLHFFSPVDKMALLEIISGKETSPATLAKAFDFARQIGKTPIVVNDSRGFFTSRVIGTFLHEAVAMVAEGIAPASIEQAGLQAGYPAAPLQLCDELNLSLMSRIAKETKEGLAADGGKRVYFDHPANAVVDRMLEEFDRAGKLAGAGFYDYNEERRTQLWPGLMDHFGAGAVQIPFVDMQERMLFAESLETIRCFEEGVMCSVEDANIGSILGIGFPGWTGGVIQYINGYPGGLVGFVARARELAAAYGPQFTPPASLVAKAEAGQTY